MMDTTIIYNDYLSGDAKALERLMEIYGDKLTLYINGYIKNLHDSEDLLIEVFAYLISKRPNIKSSFESYIYKAARNHVFEEGKKTYHSYRGGNEFLHRKYI